MRGIHLDKKLFKTIFTINKEFYFRTCKFVLCKNADTINYISGTILLAVALKSVNPLSTYAAIKRKK